MKLRTVITKFFRSPNCAIVTFFTGLIWPVFALVFGWLPPSYVDGKQVSYLTIYDAFLYAFMIFWCILIAYADLKQKLNDSQNQH